MATIRVFQYLNSETKTPADYAVCTLEIPGPFRDLDHIREVNIAKGGHYFDKGAMRGFRSRPYHQCFYGRFFIDSTQFVSTTGYKAPRTWKIRALDNDGSTMSVVAQDSKGDWQEEFPSLYYAKQAIERLVKIAQEPTWENQLTMADNLSSSELKRHACVSTSNHHRCEDCFCCAALTVLERRKEQGVKC